MNNNSAICKEIYDNLEKFIKKRLKKKKLKIKKIKL